VEQILITGLDGSGKSTVFSKLEQKISTGNFDIIRLPHINSETLEKGSPLQGAAEFVNFLNSTADLQNNSKLKAVALFASMLVFRKLVEYKSQPGINRIYLERHPLIDTMVYAMFYAGKAKTEADNHTDIDEIGLPYITEIEYIFDLIPEEFDKSQLKGLTGLAEFIHQHFYLNREQGFLFLKKLYGVDLPSKIYYLKARPSVLWQRISNRQVFEAHETLETLSLLDKTYDKFFSELSEQNKGLIEIIDASSFESLNRFFEKINPGCA
jgi:thymidylate kinase